MVRRPVGSVKPMPPLPSEGLAPAAVFDYEHPVRGRGSRGNEMDYTITRMQGLFVLLLATAGCAEETVNDGERCDVAQDCAESLVCALTEEGGNTRICTDYGNTRPQRMCTPGRSDVPCDLVLLHDAGESCLRSDDCRDSLICTPDGDAGSGGTCTPVGDASESKSGLVPGRRSPTWTIEAADPHPLRHACPMPTREPMLQVG